MKQEAKNRQLRAWLMTGRAITQLQALDYFGIMRLASRIFELKCKGWEFTTDIIGEERYASYKLVAIDGEPLEDYKTKKAVQQ